MWTLQWSAVQLLGVSFADSSTGTAVGSEGGILRTTNGGALWTSQLSGTTNELHGVSFTDANTGTVVGGWSAASYPGWLAVILHTTDGGATWTNVSLPTTNVLAAVCWTDANTGTAVGENGTILRTANAGTTGVEADRQRKTPQDFLLGQNYPNPFNPTTTIRYALPYRSRVNLTVYNTLGQQVAIPIHAQQEAGSYEVKFDGSALASGVYFYRLQTGGFVDTKKLLLLR
jgi:hypothetical protein